MTTDELKPCPIRMVEIYSGKHEKWKGWYNLVVNDADGEPIAGPLNPKLSNCLLTTIDAWNTRATEQELKAVIADMVEALEMYLRVRECGILNAPDELLSELPVKANQAIAKAKPYIEEK